MVAEGKCWTADLELRGFLRRSSKFATSAWSFGPLDHHKRTAPLLGKKKGKKIVMKMANFEKSPQAGASAQAGKSRSPLRGGSPSYSGVGQKRHESRDSRMIEEREDVGEKKKETRQSLRLKSRSLSCLLTPAMEDESGANISVPRTESRESVTEGGFWQSSAKRRRRNNDSELLSENEEASPAVFKAPATPTGALNAAGKIQRRKFMKQRQEEDAAQLEMELEERALNARKNRVTLGLQTTEDGDERLVEELNQRALQDLEVIGMVATKSSRLKGTFQKALKESADSIKAVVEVLSKRTSTEETNMLRVVNARLEKEMAELRREMADLRNELVQMRAAPASSSSPQRLSSVMPRSAPQSVVDLQEELSRSIMLQVGGMVNARLEALESRLLPEQRLRPPLAADCRQNGTSGASLRPRPNDGVAKGTSDPEPQKGHKGKTTPGIPVKGKAKGTKKTAPSTKGTLTQGEFSGQPLLPLPEVMEEGWSAVVKRGKKAKEPQQKSSGPPKPNNQQVKLRSSRSSAVVVTLQPGAEERGVTYQKVLAELRSKIDLASCGIVGTGLHCRRAATGARKFEVTGTTSDEKADSLAQKIRETISPELLKVSRPTKCAEMRISGLDDSISGEELARAVAQCGGCPVEAVKVGEIHQGAQGAGSAWVRCPIPAAKKLREGGRLLVGWVSARVQVLQARPMQCYRCLQKGHVRAQCVSEADHSEDCYRCGRPGHKAAQCVAKAHCTLCAAGNKPAEHRMGSKACSPPKPRKVIKVVPRTASAVPVSSGPPAQERDEEAMSYD